MKLPRLMPSQRSFKVRSPTIRRYEPVSHVANDGQAFTIFLIWSARRFLCHRSSARQPGVLDAPADGVALALLKTPSGRQSASLLFGVNHGLGSERHGLLVAPVGRTARPRGSTAAPPTDP